jgi:tetratricopeptide (TPR) repeat protein
MARIFWVLLACCFTAACPNLARSAGTLPVGVIDTLHRGELALAEQQLQKQLENIATDDNARFALGFVQVLRAFERFAQFQWQHGAKVRDFTIILPIHVKPNSLPKKIDYKTWRSAFEVAQRDLQTAEATLAKIRSDKIRVTIPLRKLRWDPDGDGTSEELTLLWHVFAQHLEKLSKRNPAVIINFDHADVFWLRGYCHALAGSLDMALALDGQTLFDMFAQFAYDRPVFSAKIAAMSPAERAAYAWPDSNELRFVERGRWQQARQHFLLLTEMAIANWEASELETDDDHEWLPNLKQRGAVEVTAAMVEAWREAVHETRAVLEGRKYAPLVGSELKGFDLKLFLDEPPRNLHLLMLYGYDLRGYTKVGLLAKQEIYLRLPQVYLGDTQGLLFFSK